MIAKGFLNVIERQEFNENCHTLDLIRFKTHSLVILPDIV